MARSGEWPVHSGSMLTSNWLGYERFAFVLLVSTVTLMFLHRGQNSVHCQIRRETRYTNPRNQQILIFQIFFNILIFVGGGMNGLTFCGTFTELSKLIPGAAFPDSMNLGNSKPKTGCDVVVTADCGTAAAFPSGRKFPAHHVYIIVSNRNRCIGNYWRAHMWLDCR